MSRETMRAAVYREKGTLEVVEVELPRIGPSEVLVEVEYCGVCGTDLHDVLDGWGVPDSVGGHEWSGRVVEAGSDTALEVGALVVGYPGTWCGRCPACQAGRPNLCEVRPVAGVEKTHGAFADYVVVDGDRAMVAPTGMEAQAAAYAEPLAVALHALDLADVAPADRLMVSGCGPIGAAVVASLRVRGHRDVVVVEPSPVRSDLAVRLGASVLAPSDLEAPWHPGVIVEQPAEALIETSGVRSAAEVGIAQLAPGGRMILVGTGLDFPRLDTNRIILNELVVTGAYTYNDTGFESALNLIASGALPLDELLEPEAVGLDELFEAMVRLRAGEVAGKILVRP
jgi:2-desacetyl-2-hydroxyethyl bacteriochlorophyllide A dehydrogenase